MHVLLQTFQVAIQKANKMKNIMYLIHTDIKNSVHILMHVFGKTIYQFLWIEFS